MALGLRIGVRRVVTRLTDLIRLTGARRLMPKPEYLYDEPLTTLRRRIILRLTLPVIKSASLLAAHTRADRLIFPIVLLTTPRP